jgi:ABC-type transport system involved in multi-copper enzyme maturation permease subunit
MPIHDQGYRHYTGPRTLHGRAWWVIARAGILERLRERRFLGLLLFAWLPFVMRAVQLYIAATFPQASFLAPDEQTFREFLTQQRMFLFFVTIYVGAGLIANDRRANALQIYLSHPLARAEYIGGKLLTLLVFLAAVTWLPAVLLVVLQMMFSGDTKFIAAHPYLIPALTLVCALQVSVAAVTMLALSSLSRSRRFVSMLYAGIGLFAAAMDQALRAATGSRAWAWVSPQDTLAVVTDAIFGVSREPALPVAVAVALVAALIAISIAVLERRVRAVEVV